MNTSTPRRSTHSTPPPSVRRVTFRPSTRLSVWDGIVFGIVAASVVIVVMWMLTLASEVVPSGDSLPLLPPCPTEDSTGCYWDGDIMGNRTGVDIVSVTQESE